MDTRIRTAEEPGDGVSHWVIVLTDEQKSLVRLLGLQKQAYRKYAQWDEAERAARRLGEAMYGKHRRDG